MSPLKLTLWCWLCSKDFRHWNQIEVAEDKTIMHVIKLVTPLLPADAIPNVNVFKPRGRINCDKYLVDTLGELTRSKLKEPLSYTRKLSGLVNARTPKNSLHLWSSICTFIIYPEYISIYPEMITNDLCRMKTIYAECKLFMPDANDLL